MAYLGYKHTEKALAKMKGRQFSSEHIKKLSESKKGFKHTDETKIRMSNAQKGKTVSQITRQKIRQSLMGHEVLAIVRAKISEKNKGMIQTREECLAKSKRQSGENSYLWRGGLTSLNEKIRKGVEYRIWRQAVFRRDNWTCVLCFARGKKATPVTLNADHIKPFAMYPELRLSVENGRTLCVPCHKKTDTWGYGTRKLMHRTNVAESDI